MLVEKKSRQRKKKMLRIRSLEVKVEEACPSNIHSLCFQVPCPIKWLCVPWNCCRWSLMHMAHIRISRRHIIIQGGWEQSRGVISSYSGWTPNHKSDRTLPGNWLCNFALEWFSRKALWFMFFGAETDSSSDRQMLFMINNLQVKVKIMGTPKCQFWVSPTVTDEVSSPEGLQLLANHLPAGSC